MKKIALSLLLATNLNAAPLLLVDDDGGKNYEKNYQQWCSDARLPYEYWETKAQDIPLLETMTNYRTILWFTGDQWNALDNDEVKRIKEYLDDRVGYRSLFMTGDHLARDTREGFNDAHQFLGWYLNARYIKTEGDPIVGVNEQSDVFQRAFLPAIFHGYTGAGNYSFPLWNMADIVKPNDWSHRAVMLPHKNTVEGKKETLEAVAVSNRKHFKTVFVTFDLAHEDSRYINEPEFIRTCVEWLQR